jgi:hypothetical protein
LQERAGYYRDMAEEAMRLAQSSPALQVYYLNLVAGWKSLADEAEWEQERRGRISAILAAHGIENDAQPAGIKPAP